MRYHFGGDPDLDYEYQELDPRRLMQLTEVCSLEMCILSQPKEITLNASSLGVFYLMISFHSL